ncbi:MAG: cupredoxin domain-containing protein, partial [candidate division Zixibacteria bacterium]|nr:cupredoxin domain-containing protein [candidate division Zixibacteria bacterium]
MALLSGNALQGSSIMVIFALGTLPSLLAIGFGSIKLLEKQHLASVFVKVAAILVLFFALYNINAQFNVLGLPNFSSINLQKKVTPKTNNNDNDLPPIVDGKQVIKMQANSSGYTPNTFKVRTNVPVRWEITDTGTSGCTNAVLSKSLFPDPIQLSPGKTSIQEFTPTAPGNYRFSCWMGMVNGSIEVVDT